MVLVWLTLMAFALATPINHDEDQYIGTAMAAVRGRPYADFVYLQTPLQPLLTSPVMTLPAGTRLIALRGATALLGTLLLLGVYVAARGGGARPKGAAQAAGLAGACHAFLFAAVHVRNDILPGLLLTWAIASVLTALRWPRVARVCWLVAGLLLGLAVSAKISAALPAAAIGGWLLLDRKVRGAGVVTLAGLGALLGLLPTAWLVWHAPDAAFYEIVTFARLAPASWYNLNGYGDRLGLSAKLTDSLQVLAAGPFLFAVVLCLVARPPRLGRRERLLLVTTLAGGLAAILPTPTWRQYFIPLVPPLFIAMALVRPRGLARREWAVVLPFALVGLAPHARDLAVASGSGKWPALQARREALWIGRALQPGAIIATLSATRILDSGARLDPRFASGVFFYRTGDMLSLSAIRRLKAVSPGTTVALLDERPPDAIVVGYENGDNLDRFGLERPLVAYARARGYAPVRSPFGAAVVWRRLERGRSESSQ